MRGGRARAALAGAVALTVAAALAACGSSTTPPSTSASPVSSPTGAPSASGSASPSPTSLNNQAASLALSADQLPASPVGQLTLQSDSLLSGEGNTDARVFASAGHSFALEIDVLPDTSPAAASNDYAAVRNAAQSRVTTVSSTTSPNIGDQADEYVGTTSDGRHIVAIAFQQGAVLVAVLTESSSDAQADYAAAVATAQAQKIKSLS